MHRFALRSNHVTTRITTRMSELLQVAADSDALAPLSRICPLLVAVPLLLSLRLRIKRSSTALPGKYLSSSSRTATRELLDPPSSLRVVKLARQWMLDATRHLPSRRSTNGPVSPRGQTTKMRRTSLGIGGQFGEYWTRNGRSRSARAMRGGRQMTYRSTMALLRRMRVRRPQQGVCLK